MKYGEHTVALAVSVHILVVGREGGHVHVVVTSGAGVLVGHCQDCIQLPPSSRTGYSASQKHPSTHFGRHVGVAFKFVHRFSQLGPVKQVSTPKCKPKKRRTAGGISLVRCCAVAGRQLRQASVRKTLRD